MVVEIVKVGSSTLLGELSFRHAFVQVDSRRLACLRFRTCCVPIATLNQNKRSRLLYLGNVQITTHHHLMWRVFIAPCHALELTAVN